MRLVARARAREDISDIVGTVVKVFGVREDRFLVAFLIVLDTCKYTKRLQSLIYMGCLRHCRGTSSDEDTLYFAN